MEQNNGKEHQQNQQQQSNAFPVHPQPTQLWNHHAPAFRPGPHVPLPDTNQHNYHRSLAPPQPLIPPPFLLPGVPHIPYLNGGAPPFAAFPYQGVLPPLYPPMLHPRHYQPPLPSQSQLNFSILQQQTETTNALLNEAAAATTALQMVFQSMAARQQQQNHQQPQLSSLLGSSFNANSNSSSSSSSTATQPSTPGPTGSSGPLSTASSVSMSPSSERPEEHQAFSAVHQHHHQGMAAPMVMPSPYHAYPPFANHGPFFLNQHYQHYPLMLFSQPFLEIRTKIGLPKSLHLKALTESEKAHGNRCLFFFRRDLLHSRRPISELQSKHVKKQLFEIIERYFNHLHSQLYANEHAINQENYYDTCELYRTLINTKYYPFDDFVVYGERFKHFLEQFMNNRQEKNHYIAILEVYQSLIPPNIVCFRKRLLQILESPEPSVSRQCPVNLKMATYLVVDERKLFSTVIQIGNVQDAIEYFIKAVSLTADGKNNLKLFKDLVKGVLEEAMPELGPSVSPFGSFINGLALYDSDLDLVVHCKASPFRPYEHMDYWTAFLLLEVIEKTLQRQLVLASPSPGPGSQQVGRIVTSRRCPIVKLDFTSAFPELRAEVERLNRHAPMVLKLNQCDISVTSHYGIFNSNLLKFYSDFDRRFTELSIVLKYWLKKNELIGTKALSSYALQLMIIFFLQTRSPPVLPSLEQLRLLATEETVVNGNVNITFCQDVYRVRARWSPTPKVNLDPTSELLVDFLNYYYHFNYNVYAITPRTGQLITKAALCNEKPYRDRLHFRESFFTIEDPFVADHNVGGIFKSTLKDHFRDVFTRALFTLNINSTNCLAVLTNPDNFIKAPKI